MAYQNQSGVLVAYKAQSALGSIASGSGASYLPLTGGTLKLAKAAIASQQVRQDGLQTRGRHGLKQFTASYKGELQQTNFDAWLEAVMRGTFASGATITEATGAMSSATLSATGSVITFSAGDVRTAGVRMYDVIEFSVGLAVADTNVPLRVVGMTATTITVAETLTTVAGPVATYSFSVKGRKLVNPTSSLVRTYFTLEEYENIIDASTYAGDVRVGKFMLGMQPNAMVTTQFDLVGTGNIATATAGSAPYFSSPTLPSSTATPLAALDAVVRLGSGDLVSLTSFNMTLDLKLNASAVAGATVSPDVFDGILGVSLSLTTLRSNLTPFADFLAETTASLIFKATVPGTSPAEFVTFVVPYFTFGSVDPSEIRREGGPRTHTINIPEALVGVDPSGTGYDATMVKIQSST